MIVMRKQNCFVIKPLQFCRQLIYKHQFFHRNRLRRARAHREKKSPDKSKRGLHRFYGRFTFFYE